MYFVVIDVQQLAMRLRLSSGNPSSDTLGWLDRHGFVRAPDGWFGSADGMNSLSCSEIVFSEWRHPYNSEPARVRPLAG